MPIICIALWFVPLLIATPIAIEDLIKILQDRIEEIQKISECEAK